jgi:hypothetical protein
MIVLLSDKNPAAQQKSPMGVKEIITDPNFLGLPAVEQQNDYDAQRRHPGFQSQHSALARSDALEPLSLPGRVFGRPGGGSLILGISSQADKLRDAAIDHALCRFERIVTPESSFRCYNVAGLAAWFSLCTVVHILCLGILICPTALSNLIFDRSLDCDSFRRAG